MDLKFNSGKQNAGGVVVVCCGVVWCGVVWCGVVWCGVVWCGVVWCGVVWCGVVWCAEGAVTRRQWPGCLPTGTGKRVWCGVVWCGVVQVVQRGAVWYLLGLLHQGVSKGGIDPGGGGRSGEGEMGAPASGYPIKVRDCAVYTLLSHINCEMLLSQTLSHTPHHTAPHNTTPQHATPHCTTPRHTKCFPVLKSNTSDPSFFTRSLACLLDKRRGRNRQFVTQPDIRSQQKAIAMPQTCNLGSSSMTNTKLMQCMDLEQRRRGGG